MKDSLKNINPEELSFEKVWLLFKETDKKIKQAFEELAESMKETDERFKETDVKFKETDKKLESLIKSNQRFSNFINNYADTTEIMFYEALETLVSKGKLNIFGYRFTDIKRNYEIGKLKKHKEVDILLIDDAKKMLGIIEVKTKLHQKNFEKIEKIKEYLQYDRAFETYGYIYGFASLNINSKCEEYAKEYGVFLIKPTNDETSIQLEYLQQFSPIVF